MVLNAYVFINVVLGSTFEEYLPASNCLRDILKDCIYLKSGTVELQWLENLWDH